MYVGVDEIKAEAPIPGSWILHMRESLQETRWALGLKEGDPTTVAIVLLDLPVVPWYTSGSPMVVLMSNSIREKHWPKLRKALEKHPLPEGTYHRSQLGIDHSQLDGFKGAYGWGPHEKKLQQFQKDVDGGKFIDETGSPCDTCVDEQQFYGCPFCDFNPLADEMEEEWEDPEYDTGPYGGYP